MEIEQTTPEEQRAETFRQYAAGQLHEQTKSLGTIRALMILWTVVSAVGIALLLTGAAVGF